MTIKKRNPLMVLALFITIVYAYTAVSYLLDWSSLDSAIDRPQWYVFTFALVNIGLTVSLLAILGGKKWGKYGIFISLIFQVAFFTIATEKSLPYFIFSIMALSIVAVTILLLDYAERLTIHD